MKRLTKNSVKDIIFDYFVIFLGSAIFALSFNMFIQHSHIALGGITGIAMVINYFFPSLSMGLLTFLLNIPFLLLGLWKIGGTFMTRTVFASVSLSLVMQLTENFPPLTDDLLLCAIFGGIGAGVGIGLVFTRKGSTGGSDIIGLVLKQKYSGIPLGKLVLAADAIIVLCASWAFQSINSVLYAIIKMYVASIATDGVLYGFTTDKFVYIISQKAETISKLVISELHHGATILSGEGAFAKEQRKLILCAINPNQIALLKEIVRNEDESAFMIVTDTHEVLGFGFKPNINSGL